jgi:hypothetical protein
VTSAHDPLPEYLGSEPNPTTGTVFYVLLDHLMRLQESLD